MTIDLRRAPEGATHYADGGPGMNVFVWYKDVTPHSCEWMNFGRSSAWQRSNLAPRYRIKPIHAAQWDGVGRPPVGTEFEWRYGGHAWKTGVALYIGSVYVILKARDQEQHYYLRDMEFRPIRTPEQIAAEERERVIDAMVKFCPYPGSDCTRIDCAALYDAGVRPPGAVR